MTSTQNNSSEKKSDDTRMRIFSCTLSLIEKIGAEQVTIRKIAEEAGVSPALIIQYFGSKGDLLQQAFELRNDELVDTIKALKTSSFTSPCDLLLDFARIQMSRDMSYPTLTLQVLANAFSWETDGYVQVDERLAPFHNAQREVLSALMPSLPDEYLRTLPLTFFLIYAQGLRRMLKQGMTSEEGLGYLRPHFQILADAISSKTNG
ncbi:MAG: hypothetical protein CBB65_00150 [Hyphomonadaceae bacterium TMED5]|nr:hypothetical protein [Ponticaulis sp.]OUY01566.1 MAG: hypothetical protein CBB65_00150 [Hyphomonadaceae bacterium TMED5]|tara:strand:- start:1163 stop:1780 length:618 start_codon:yes stop_codon:yes gene_type:complete